MFSLKTFVKLLIILLSCISSSISNKVRFFCPNICYGLLIFFSFYIFLFFYLILLIQMSKRYKIEEQNIDFGDFLLNSPNRGAQLAQLQMLTDSKRRKAPIVLSPEQIKQEQDQLNSSRWFLYLNIYVKNNF